MDLRQLRYFVAIVEQGSFSRAASVLNVAQPALSLHVRNMEAHLGTQLLCRGPRGVVPTEAGEILLRHARIILNQLAIAEEQVRGGIAEPAGPVRLGLPGTIAEIVSVPLFVAAQQRFPKVQLRLAEAMSGFVTEWLIDGRIDLALIYRPPEGLGIAATEILREELVFFGPLDRIATLDLPPPGKPLCFDLLSRIPLVVPGQAHGLRVLLDDLARARRVRLKVAVEVDSYSNIRELVKAGFGCSILPRHVIAGEIAAGTMQAWSIESPAVRRGVFLARRDVRPMTRAVAAIGGLVPEVLRDLVASGAWTGAIPVAAEETDG